jgi:hypothetical protein
MKATLSSKFLSTFSFLAGASVVTGADHVWTNGAADFVWDGSSANWTSPTSWVNGNDAIFGASGIGSISVGQEFPPIA